MRITGKKYHLIPMKLPSLLWDPWNIWANENTGSDNESKEKTNLNYSTELYNVYEYTIVKSKINKMLTTIRMECATLVTCWDENNLTAIAATIQKLTRTENISFSKFVIEMKDFFLLFCGTILWITSSVFQKKT